MDDDDEIFDGSGKSIRLIGSSWIWDLKICSSVDEINIDCGSKNDD